MRQVVPTTIQKYNRASDMDENKPNHFYALQLSLQALELRTFPLTNDGPLRIVNDKFITAGCLRSL